MDFLASDRMAPPSHVICGSEVYMPTTVKHQKYEPNLPDMPHAINVCLESTMFMLVTLLLILDLVTDVWVLAEFGVSQNTVLMGVSVLWLAVSSFCVAVAYFVMSKDKKSGKDSDSGSSAACFCTNIFCQLGIVGHRFQHFSRKVEMCRPETDTKDWSNKYKQLMLRRDWLFARLFLAHAILQSIPMLIINLLAMLIYSDPHGVQYVSAVVSILCILFSMVIHEKARKQRLRKTHVGPFQSLCIFLFHGLIVMARVIAIVIFCYFYRKWLAAILVPHFILIGLFFLVVYRNVWKVRSYKVIIHSFYCIFAYFPLHNEYRPEGEIVLFYFLFMLENIIMISLPYGVDPMYPVRADYVPGTGFYKTLTILVLVGSALGLFFMALYYFFLHKSSRDIQESNFSCFSSLCDFNSKPPVLTRVPVDQSLQIGHIYLRENMDNEQLTRHASMDMLNDDDDYKKYMMDYGEEVGPPPAYRSQQRLYRKRGESVGTDLDSRRSLSDFSDAKAPLSNNSEPSEHSAFIADDLNISDVKPLQMII